MANTKSAKKAKRVSDRRNKVNTKAKDLYKTVRTDIRKTLAEGDKSKAEKMFVEFQSAIDIAIKKGVIKRNTGSRYKSRVSSAIKKAK